MVNARGVFVVACCWCTFTLCGSNQLSPVYLLSLLFHVVIGSSSSSTISFRISCDRSKFSVVVFFLPSPSLKTWYLLFVLCLLHICNECMSCFVRCVITIFGVERRCSSYSPTHLSPSLFRPFISLSPLTTHFRPHFPSNPPVPSLPPFFFIVTLAQRRKKRRFRKMFDDCTMPFFSMFLPTAIYRSYGK